MHDSLRFWAKTFSAPAGGVAFKPVLHHLLDVAAVAASYLHLQSARLAREAAMCGVSAEEYVALVAFLSGLHDLGKFTRNFQAKVESLWPAALGSWPGLNAVGLAHWRATGLMLQLNPFRSAMARLLPNIQSGEGALLAAIAGHHGRPPPDCDDADVAGEALRKSHWLDAACLGAAWFAFEELRRLTSAQPVAGLNADSAPELSWRLAGLITLADWVGSDADYFSPLPLDTPLEIYWREAKRTAQRALSAKGLAPLKAASAPSLGRIAPRAATSARPMQRLSEELTLGTGPQLILIEDATGSGKTEAALLLAARMIETGLGEGVYFALPTMATANAMHKRLVEMVPCLFADDPEARPPSVILSHGKAKIAETLARLTARPSGDGEETTAASCNDWIADDRRRAFFADVGAGTIDQAFLAVLPKKYLTLRQYALAGRILIVDEAHCFDAYMKEELGTLLRLHAMNGGSAIVLSATLALSIRRQITRSYYAGLGLGRLEVRKGAARCASMAYPLLTHLTREGFAEHARQLDPKLSRKVRVERLNSREASLRAASAAADSDASVLIICNAVDEAIALHEKLTARRPKETTHLFHARFAQGDRIAIEDAVLWRFGRDATRAQRAGHILVATQVVEQSLDLDFDLIVSDLAPIDLLIQRAGRLWRHMDLRPAADRAIAEPKLLVVSPDPDAIASADWLATCLGRAAYVYQNAGVMWRTARTIFSGRVLATPEILRPMIEAVYGENAEAVPACLRAAETKGEGQEGKAKAIGAFNVIDLGGGYGQLPSDLRADEDIGTRLGEPTLTIRMARRENGGLVPWFRAGGAAPFDWALSELRIRKALWGGAKAPPEDAPLLERATKEWTEWDRSIVLAEVGVDGRVRVQNGDFHYSSIVGLRRIASQGVELSGRSGSP
jgi:CRISPR-associated endonuclease/helicase Cas3